MGTPYEKRGSTDAIIFISFYGYALLFAYQEKCLWAFFVYKII